MFLPVACHAGRRYSCPTTLLNELTDILFHSLLKSLRCLVDLLNKSPPLKSNVISVSHLSSSRVGECLRLYSRYSRELGSIFHIWNVTTWGLEVTCRKIRVAVTCKWRSLRQVTTSVQIPSMLTYFILVHNMHHSINPVKYF